jgi:hypothetical protein
MKKAKRPVDGDEPLDEYDFSQGIRGKYAAPYNRGSNIVLLEPDVARAFPSAQAVNTALRRLIESPVKDD